MADFYSNWETRSESDLKSMTSVEIHLVFVFISTSFVFLYHNNVFMIRQGQLLFCKNWLRPSYRSTLPFYRASKTASVCQLQRKEHSRHNRGAHTVKPRNTGPKSNGNPPITIAKPWSLQVIPFYFLYWQ